MWQKEAKCFQEASPRCEGLQTHLNPTGLLLIAFDVHVNMTCFNIPAQSIPSSEDGAKGRDLEEWLVGGGWLPLTVTGCQACLYPPLNYHHPHMSVSCPFPDPHFCPHCHVPLSFRLPLYLSVMCASWHIIKRHFCESMILNRAGPVPWICSGWQPTVLLCLISAPY